jgi:hypothetical protein
MTKTELTSYSEEEYPRFALHAEIFESEGSQTWAREHPCNPLILPGDTRYQDVQEAMRQEETVFTDIQQQIAVLQGQLRASRVRFSRLASQIAPIQRIPDELLSKIFLADSLHATFADYEDLLSLNLVCSKWRRVALDTPLLWTDVTIRWGMSHAKKGRNLNPTSDRLQSWLKLSKYALLSLDLFFPMSGGNNEHICDALSHTLLLERERWKSLRVEGNQTITALKRVMSSVLVAQRLKPQMLQYLEFASIEVMEDNIFEGIQATKVVKLKFDDMSFSRKALMSLLSSTPNIETLVFRHCSLDEHSEPVPSNPELQLNELKYIIWDLQHDSSDEADVQLLEILAHVLASATALEKLSVFGSDSSVYNPLWGAAGGRAQRLQSYPKSSTVVKLNLKLRIMDLDLLDASMKSMTEFVALFPRTETFTLRFFWSEDTDDVMQRETLVNSTSAIISAIRSLGVKHLKTVKLCKIPLDKAQIEPLSSFLTDSGVRVDLDVCQTFSAEGDQPEFEVGEFIWENEGSHDILDYGFESDEDSDSPSSEI